MQALPVLLLDPRKGSGDLLPLLPRETVLSHLNDAEGRGIGDAASSGYGPLGPITWGVEVKRLGDALQCLQDGRLAASQLVRMHDHYDYVFLLIEEMLRVDPASGYLQKHIRKQDARTKKWSEYWTDAMYGAGERVIAADFFEWLTSLSICGGARLLQSSSRAETAAWIAALWKFFGKPWDQHRSLKVFDTSHQPRFVIPSMTAKIAHTLVDGVGWEKAMIAAAHFSTPRALMNATADDWRTVSGIGDALAERAVAAALAEHTHIEKRGGRDGARTAGAYRDVSAAPDHSAAKKRRAGAVPLPRQNAPAPGRGTRRRKQTKG